MTYIHQTPEFFRIKLYQKAKDFKGFSNLSEEDLANIAKKVYNKQENGLYVNPQSYNEDNLTKYLSVLKYLTNPHIHLEIKSFDERILYLIMSTDPDLITFKEFLKTNITPVRSINNEQDPKKKEELALQREQEILDLQNRVRTQLGFYDSHLLKYEEVYFKKFICEKEIITKVNQDYITGLIGIIPFISSLHTISDERYQVLQEKAQIWLATTNANHDLYTSAYSCCVQRDTIGLRNIFEQLIFLILTSDPELNYLKIYEEESQISEVERRCQEEFCYYNKNLIELEKLYHQRFCPTKEISPWTYM